MIKVDLETMPKGYVFCLREDCSRCKTCLHWLAYKQRPVTKEVEIYDPRWIDENGGTEACTHYADCTPVVYASGFVHMFDNLPKAQGDMLRDKLTYMFDLYNYYRYRRGEFLMPPSVQKQITDAAAELGITAPIVFDKYVTRHFWCDQKVKG